MVELAVNKELLPKVWKFAKPYIEQSQKRGNCTYPIDDIYKDLEDNKKILVKLVDNKKFAWLVLGVVANSQERIAKLYYIGGVGALDFIEKIDEFCKKYAEWNMCKYISFAGRIGWGKVLKPLNWKKISINYVREV